MKKMVTVIAAYTVALFAAAFIVGIVIAAGAVLSAAVAGG